jgi:catecholate siderophore receptor
MGQQKAETSGRPCGLQPNRHPSIRAAARAPVGLAAGLASALLAGTAQAQQQDSVELPTVDVESQAKGGYQADNSTLTRVPTKLIDTPQTINVVPQQVMQEQRTSTLVEALRNVPGITFSAGEGGTQGDNINIRGYTARNDIYRDGIRDPGWYTRDAFSMESVEVLKGPSSFLFGRGSTGGVVNETTKLPKFTDFNEVEISGSTAPGVRTTADFNRTFGDVAARVVVLGTMTDIAGRDVTDVKRFGIAPSVTANLSDQTKLTLSYIYQKDDNIPDYGIVMLPGSYFGRSYGQPAPVPRSTWYGQLTPGLNDTELVDAHTGTIRLEHEFDKDMKIVNTTRYTDVDRFTRVRAVQANYTTGNVFPVPVGGTAFTDPGNPMPAGFPLSSLWLANTNHFQNYTTNTLLTNQTDFVARFDTGPFNHTFVSGMEISRETREHDRTMITEAGRINIGDPDPYFPVPTLAGTTSLTHGTTDTFGVYAADQLKVNQYLELLGGVRFDQFRGTQKASTYTIATGLTNPGSGTTPPYLNSDNAFVSWRGGVVVHPLPNTSVYFMYGTSANPPAEFVTLTNGQQNFDPVISQTYEAGAKADVLDGRLSLTAAVFRTVKQNDLENQGTAAVPLYVAVGTTRVQGFEIGAVGKLTDAWNIYAGYTYLDSRVLQSVTTANIGHELAQTPNNSFSLWTTYDITRQWTVGAGAFFVDDRWTNSNNQFIAPAYWRYDAMVSYKVNDNFSLQLNAYNLLNTVNYESLAGAGWAVPGPSRYFALTAKVRW